MGMPSDGWLWNMIGLVNRRLGNWDEAIAAFERATQLSPRDVIAFSSLAETLHFLRRYPDAVRVYDRALSLAPDHYGIAVDRARRTYVLWRGQLDTLRAVLDRVPDAELGNRGTRIGQAVRLAHWERKPDSLLQILSGLPPRSVIEEQDFLLPASLFAGWAHRSRGEAAAAAESFDLARVLTDSLLTELPNDRRVHFARGLALAGLNLREGALQEARWLEQSPQYSEDRYGGTVSMHHRAQILAQVGETGAALDEIDRLLEGPSVFVSGHTVRLDPIWDALRETPRFQALLADHREVTESGAPAG